MYICAGLGYKIGRTRERRKVREIAGATIAAIRDARARAGESEHVRSAVYAVNATYTR